MRAETPGRAERPDTGSDPTLRVATASDTDTLVALLNSAYRGDTSRRGWTTEADLLGGQRVDAEGVVEALDAPGTRIIVADREGDLVACCELRDGDDGDARFGMFAVRPGEQGGGLGSLLLAEAERTAAQLGFRRMRMLVIRQRADLIAWYERRGYRRTGASAPFPYGDPRFGLPKRPDLVFDELAKPTGAEHHDRHAPA